MGDSNIMFSYVCQDSYVVRPEGGALALRINRRGELVTTDLLHQFSLDGRVFGVNLGTDTTPEDFAKTTYDADQPQLVLDVPNNTTVIPLSLRVVLETSAGTLNEVTAGVASVNVGSGTSTELTPQSIYTSQPRSTNCSVYSLYTGNGTDPTANNWLEFFRWGYAFADTSGDPAKVAMWDAKTAPFIPVVEGTGSLVVHVVGATTAPEGYATLVWAELATSDVTS